MEPGRARELGADGDPVVSVDGLRRLYSLLWAACVAVYVGVLLSSLAAGGSDLWSLAKGLAAATALALLGRMALGVLAQARRRAPAGRAETRGSLIDLVSVPDGEAIPPPAAGAGGAPRK